MTGHNGAHISDIHELPENVRGRYESWGGHFAVRDIAVAMDAARRAGGDELCEDAGSALLADPAGAAF
ncbi:MAG: hypothetical protein AAFX39_01240 [Pseudomonadota bacterium]